MAPLGYLNNPNWAGASLAPDPERAPIVRQAFEEFASGRFTKQEILARVTAAGLRNRHGRVVQPQTISNILRNPVYMGRIEVRGGLAVPADFDPLVTEATFYRVQAILDGRIVVTGPRPRNHPDFPLRGFVRCATCDRPLTGSWSTGRAGGYYAYYHCQRQCRAENIGKAALEGQFIELLADLQPSVGFIRLVKEHVLAAWRALRQESLAAVAVAGRRVQTVQQRLDCLDDAFLFAKTIDQETYTRQRDRLRQELALARVAQHEAAIDELDVEGILAFAEEVLPSAAHLWTHASLKQRQRLQQLFLPDGITCSGNQLNRTAANAPFFSRLAAVAVENSRVVGADGIEPSTPRV